MATTVVWFRNDLRVADNPALAAALQGGMAVVPVFVWEPEDGSPWQPGAASRWWLHHSLAALDAHLREMGSRLVIRRGRALETLLQLAKESAADAVMWNRCYEPAVIARDAMVKEALRAGGLAVQSFNAALLHEPWTIQNRSGRPFQVFTPFWRRCLEQPEPPKPVPSPKKISGPEKWPVSLAIDELSLEPRINWAGGLAAAWEPGEAGAARALKRFLAHGFEDYTEKRNRPDVQGTSRLSPHLHFGEVGPRQIWHGLAGMAAARDGSASAWRGSQFAAELGWREFAHHLIFHFPGTATEPLRPEFRRFAWRTDPEWLAAWQRGRTGYPIVDAGMRELWTTGWMHNRVRMITASFLVKDLRISWLEGARWFWDTLVDADLAQNTLGWQWTAGCGADATPFFRIFNPVTQGQKFDPAGAYIRRWCPELAKLPDKWVHQPDRAPAEVLRAASVELGVTYPESIVNHATAREVALEAFARIKQPGGSRA